MKCNIWWMLAVVAICLVLVPKLLSSPDAGGIGGIVLFLLMLGCCLLPMLLLAFGYGPSGRASCHGADPKNDTKPEQGTPPA